MPFETEEMVAMFIAQQECLDEEPEELRCGETAHWCIHDSCDVAIDRYLADPDKGVQVYVPGEPPPHLVHQCLMMSLRNKILEQCKGIA
jgi:hypothetical protein